MTERQQRDVLSSAGLEGLDGEHTLGVSGHRNGRRVAEVEALTSQRADGRNLGEQDPGSDTAAEVSWLVVGTGSSAANARIQFNGSKPIGLATTSSSATGSRSSSASPTILDSSDSIPAVVTSSSRLVSQELLP